MYQLLILVAILFVVFYPTIGYPKVLAARYTRLVHPYSGLDPPTWHEFKQNIRAFEAEEDVAVAAQALYRAMENIRDLGLSVQRSDDTHIQEELAGIAARLGIDGEYELYTGAKKKGYYFFPRYLNEMDNNQVVNAASLERGGTVGDAGTHFPDPKSHGQ
jgi:hypothetical protein